MGILEGCGGCCLSIVLIPLLCCGLVVGALIFIDQNAPDPPVRGNFTPNTSEAQAFENEINRAKSQASGGWFHVTVYEDQLSSWMALEGKQFAEDNGHAFPFENVQVGLDDGQLAFYGELSRYGLDVPIRVALEPQIYDQGALSLDIDEANVGGLNVPGFVLSNVSAQLDDALMQPFRDLSENVTIPREAMVIENGTLQFQGTLR